MTKIKCSTDPTAYLDSRPGPGAGSGVDAPDPPENVFFHLANVNFDADGTSGATQNFDNDFDEAPKAALFSHAQCLNADQVDTYGGRGMGYTDGTDDGHASCRSEHNVASSDCSHARNNDYAINAHAAGTTSPLFRGAGSFYSAEPGADGVRLTYERQNAAGDIPGMVLQIGGSAIQSKVISSNTINISAGGSQSLTGVGFEPDVVITCYTKVSTFSTLVLGDAAFGMGWAVKTGGGIVQNCMNCYERDGRSTPDGRIYTNGDSFYAHLGTGALNHWVEMQSFDSDGFTLAVPAESPFGSGVDMHFLCLKLANETGDVAAGQFNLPTTTGSFAVTGIPFMPRLVIQQFTGISADDTYASGNMVPTTSFLMEGTQGCSSMMSRQGSSPSATYSIQATKAVHVPNFAGGTLWEGTFDGFTGDGYAINYTSVSGGTRLAQYLAFR